MSTTVSESRTVGRYLHPHVARTVGVPLQIDHGGSSDEAQDAAVSSSYREVYYIKGEMPGGRWLRYAVPVIVRIEHDEYVASQPQLDLFAFGADAMDALFGLRDEMVSHHDRLEELGEALSPRLIRQRALLRALFAARDA